MFFYKDSFCFVRPERQHLAIHFCGVEVQVEAWIDLAISACSHYDSKPLSINQTFSLQAALPSFAIHSPRATYRIALKTSIWNE